ncbi:MAG: hypothetical protein U5R31_05900 [Acidimicrobiia bacterium]|nr:hypothetical protein [Acidimicrobiia bacterium]
MSTVVAEPARRARREMEHVERAATGPLGDGRGVVAGHRVDSHEREDVEVAVERPARLGEG